jgi:hypothetical protein
VLAVPWLRQQVEEPRERPEQRAWHAFRERAAVEPQVAREHLVAAVAVERHRDPRARELG